VLYHNLTRSGWLVMVRAQEQQVPLKRVDALVVRGGRWFGAANLGKATRMSPVVARRCH